MSSETPQHVARNAAKVAYAAWWRAKERGVPIAVDLHDHMADAVVEAIAALRAPVSAWMPIETAPRDQRLVLVGYYDTEGVWREHIAFWAMAYESAPVSQCYWRTDGGGTLLSADVHRGGSSGKPLGATHWQPLPPLPGELAVDPRVQELETLKAQLNARYESRRGPKRMLLNDYQDELEAVIGLIDARLSLLGKE